MELNSYLWFGRSWVDGGGGNRELRPREVRLGRVRPLSVVFGTKQLSLLWEVLARWELRTRIVLTCREREGSLGCEATRSAAEGQWFEGRSRVRGDVRGSNPAPPTVINKQLRPHLLYLHELQKIQH